MLSTQTAIARADALLEAIYGFECEESETPKSSYYDDYEDDYGSQYDNAEPEHYSWDNLYIDPYENIEIITDPYADLYPEESEILSEY